MRQPARSLELHQWLDDVKANAHKAMGSGAEIGACLVSNPQTGENDCVRTDQATCTKIGGVYIGGPCGPMGGEPPNRIAGSPASLFLLTREVSEILSRFRSIVACLGLRYFGAHI